MNKTFKKLALLSVAVLGAACAPTTTSQSDSSQGSSGSSDDKIVIYSNSVSNGRGDWLKEKAAENGFNI